MNILFVGKEKPPWLILHRRIFYVSNFQSRETPGTKSYIQCNIFPFVLRNCILDFIYEVLNNGSALNFAVMHCRDEHCRAAFAARFTCVFRLAS